MMRMLESMEPRERVMVTGGGIIAALILLWAFVWNPISSGRETLRLQVDNKVQVLNNLHRVSAISANEEAAGTTGGQTLFVLIDQTAQSHGLQGAITRARPNGANEINVSFTNASFDSLLTWLIALQRQSNVYVDGASINTARQRGLVSGQVLLRRL